MLRTHADVGEAEFAQDTANRVRVDNDAKPLLGNAGQINPAPAHDAVRLWIGAFLDPVREDADQPKAARAVVIPFGLEASSVPARVRRGGSTLGTATKTGGAMLTVAVNAICAPSDSRSASGLLQKRSR